MENATIVGLSLIPAEAPAPPPSPVVPINYSNTSVEMPEPLPLANLSVVLDSETGSVTYTIPNNLNMIVHPPSVVSVTSVIPGFCTGLLSPILSYPSPVTWYMLR